MNELRQSSQFRHRPVLLDEALTALIYKDTKGGVFLDGTIGGGGHAEAILTKIAPAGKLLGLDLDDEAIVASRERLKNFAPYLDIMRGNFAAVDELLNKKGITALDGALLDLGVSTHQLASAHRGFSFLHEAPLDMRMAGQQGGITAGDIIQTSKWEELARIIRDYGEEKMAKAIAKAICKRCAIAPILTTTQLASIVAGISKRHSGIHPATKTFQALRIAVNNELENLRVFIPKIVPFLNKGARLAIISFHSLEDRIVKRTFQDLASNCECPRGIPVCVCQKQPLLKIITKKPITPSIQEIMENPAARSAKLRVAERI